MFRYKVRFYRMNESPKDKPRWFEHEIIGKDDSEMQWKVFNIIKNHQSTGGRIFKTKTIWKREEV